MIRARVTLVLLAGLSLAACRMCASARPPIVPVAHVDLSRYMGRWYVIAAIPTRIEHDDYNPVETYRLERNGTSTEASDPAGMSHLRNARARQPRRRCVRSEAGRPAAHVRVVLSLAPVRGPGYNVSRTNDVPTAERAGSYARGVACAAEAANG